MGPPDSAASDQDAADREAGEWFWFAFPMMDAIKLLRVFYFLARLPA